jgi:hypothetical protein
LPWVNAHLLALLEYHLMILLGFDKDALKKKIFKKISRVDDAYRLRENTYDIERNK